MSDASRDRYGGLQRRLLEAGATQEPAEVHGTLCGALCVSDDAPTAALVEVDDPAALEPLLEALREYTLEGLFDPDFGFQPLLPPDATPLQDRVKGLASWCGGFVYGIASRGEFDLREHTEEVQEVVRDLTELSRAGLVETDDAGEQGEADYAELVEYVRVGVQLIFLELRGDRQDPPAARLH